MAYVFFNPNPRHKRTTDCTVRALCRVLDMEWDEAYYRLFLQGLYLSEMSDSGNVIRSLLREHGFRAYVAPDTCPDCYTVADFAYDNPEGAFAVMIDGSTNHVVAVVDGNWYDTWDCGDETVSFFMRKER